MKRTLGAVLALLVVMAATAGIVAWRRRAVPVQAVSVVRSDLLVRVLCDGRLEPPEGGELRVPDGGTVALIAVHEGDRVVRGQLLLSLANPDLQARARDASSEVRQLQSDTAAAGADLDRARHEAEYREQLVAGDRRLLAQGAIARATLDADQLAWQQALDHMREIEARLDALRRSAAAAPAPAGGGAAGEGVPGGASADGGHRPAAAAPRAERGGGGSRLGLAQSVAAELAHRVAALAVHAPADGVVYGLPHAAGETVQPGQLVASVTDPDHPHVRCRVDQPDLPRVAPGQRLIVTFNGLPDRQWDGTVRRVGTGLREAGGREVGELVGELADPVHSLPANAAVDVQVVVAQKRGVLSIPRSALRRDSDQADEDAGLPSGAGTRGAKTPPPTPGAGTGTGGPRPEAPGGGVDTTPGRFVYVVVRRRAHRRDVSVGLIGLSQVEVLTGLHEGERVVAEGPPSLSEDARVVEAKSH